MHLHIWQRHGRAWPRDVLRLPREAFTMKRGSFRYRDVEIEEHVSCNGFVYWRIPAVDDWDYLNGEALQARIDRFLLERIK